MDAEARLESLFDKYGMRMVVFKETRDEFGDVIYWAHPHGNDLRNAEAWHGDVVLKMILELEEKGWRAGWVPERNAVVVKSPQGSPHPPEWAEARARIEFERKKERALELMSTQGREAALALFTEEERKHLPF